MQMREEKNEMQTIGDDAFAAAHFSTHKSFVFEFIFLLLLLLFLDNWEKVRLCQHRRISIYAHTAPIFTLSMVSLVNELGVRAMCARTRTRIRNCEWKNKQIDEIINVNNSEGTQDSTQEEEENMWTKQHTHTHIHRDRWVYVTTVP